VAPGNFRLRRLRSAEDVYVFHGVARDNPGDHRLFALAEVRDLTPARGAAGTVRYPRLELMGLIALSAMLEALTAFPGRDRPAANRIVLYVRPPWDVERDEGLAGAARAVKTSTGLNPQLAGIALDPGQLTLPVHGAAGDDGRGQQGIAVQQLGPLLVRHLHSIPRSRSTTNGRSALCRQSLSSRS
jgi:hypothetical protein